VRSASYFLAALVVGWLVWDAYQPARIRVDGTCLSFDQSTVRTTDSGFLSPRLTPVFLVDYQPSQALERKLAGTDLATSFRKRRGARGPVDADYARGLKKCNRIAADFKLFATRDNGKSECYVTSDRTIYDPGLVDAEYGPIRITCNDNPAIPNCSMEDLQTDGWVSWTTFPRAYLADWQHMSDVVDDYFNKNFKDCGDG
jgi:hypothetical protein